jgi:hypothetical protein
MRALPVVIGLIVFGALSLGAGAASSADRHFWPLKLTKANATYADFQSDRNACAEATKDAQRRSAISSPGVSWSGVWHSGLQVDNYRFFLRCMEDKGYSRDANGFKVGQL